MPRQTQIIATLGPKSWDEKILEGMIKAGANVIRLNMSHVRSDHDYNFLAKIVVNVRKIAEKLELPIRVMVDCPGHKFRLWEFVAREVALNSYIELTATKNPENGEIPFPHEQYLALMKVDQEIVIGDGSPRFKVARVVTTEHPKVLCYTTMAGLLEPFKGLTVRGGLRIKDLNLPALAEADKRALQFAVDVKADQAVMSYGSSAVQMRIFRDYYHRLGGDGQVIFKYELGEAGDDLSAIIEASDGCVVGQGDLGLSIPSENVPAEALRVIGAYRRAGKPCIVGTQLLSSMKYHPYPTHGERAGIHHYVDRSSRQRPTGLMVSDETTMGRYPVEVVEVLARNIVAAEACGVSIK